MSRLLPIKNNHIWLRPRRVMSNLGLQPNPQIILLAFLPPAGSRKSSYAPGFSRFPMERVFWLTWEFRGSYTSMIASQALGSIRNGQRRGLA
jgi:hypothetical protein